ncbi:MAG: DUF4465 domain-containing protein [Bacteroidota bacterium]|nr:DUF4465 domain-containing protein [Bacteroidota bacterium]
MNIHLQKLKICLLWVLFAGTLHAQTISSFENLNLSTNTYWNGKDYSGGFSSGNAFFANYFDSTFGVYWEGFSASTTTDDSTVSYTNQYSAITGKGYNNSNTYAVNYTGGKIRLTGAAAGKPVSGFYITNSTIGYYGLKNGTAFSRKFGDSSGNTPDYFYVSIKGWKGSITTSDSVKFYLADYRNSDNSKDYIVKTWEWVDLSSLGNIDSLSFTYYSSDTGSWGPNNPLYFCMDNFTTKDIGAGIESIEIAQGVNLFPNPAYDVLNIILDHELEWVKVLNLQGELLIEQVNSRVDIGGLKTGVYLVQVKTNLGFINEKFVKL